MVELYKKYRPKTLKALVGNKDMVSSLTKAIEAEELPHSILLTGPFGCGKTTVGRIIKEQLGIHDMDYYELDTGVFNGIDTVREIRNKMAFKPMYSPYRIWLLDEVHQLGVGKEGKNKAQNALLKALEDTPPHVIFILCTTNPEMLIKTVKSRCVEYKVSKLSESEMTILLKRISKKEGTTINQKVIRKIIENADGHVRNALQMLERVYKLDDIEEQLRLCVLDQEGEEAQINQLCQALLKGAGWQDVRKLLLGLKEVEPETIRRAIIGYANAVLLNGGEDASLILGWFLYRTTYDSGTGLITQFCYNIVKGIEPPC